MSAGDLGDLRSKAVDAFQTLYAGGGVRDRTSCAWHLTENGPVRRDQRREQAVAERACAEMAA